MARSEALARAVAGSDAMSGVVPLTAADVDAGLALSDAAGWNQTADDWRFFIARGRAVGLREATGRLVATAAALPYGPASGWISMVLVADGWRHRGLASRLVDACVEALRSLGRVPVLDATPAGAEVYRRIGFVAGAGFDRWQHESSPGAAALGDATARGGEAVRPAGLAELDVIAAQDRAASGLDRRALLEAFLSRPGTKAWRSADGRGFAIARAGRRATQIGPLVAGDPAAAQALLETAVAASQRSADRVFLDLPSTPSSIAAALQRRGWTRQRSFVRMALGAPEPPTIDAACVVLAGPEFG